MNTDGRRNAWLKLSAHYRETGTETTISHLFETDPQRFQRLSIEHGEILLDYSKNLVTDKTLELLQQLAEKSGLPEAIAAMFRGDEINVTEQRPALHVALRSNLPDADPEFSAVVSATLEKMQAFVAQLHSGDWKGYSGKTITRVINIGIGGS